MIIYTIIQTSVYKKDLRLAKRRGLDLRKLNEVVGMLAQGQKLPEKCHDHALKGEWQGNRECHVAPNWLLIYRKNEHTVELRLVRTGTHDDLELEYPHSPSLHSPKSDDQAPQA